MKPTIYKCNFRKVEKVPWTIFFSWNCPWNVFSQ